jgi:hypothetical protein
MPPHDLIMPTASQSHTTFPRQFIDINFLQVRLFLKLNFDFPRCFREGRNIPKTLILPTIDTAALAPRTIKMIMVVIIFRVTVFRHTVRIATKYLRSSAEGSHSKTKTAYGFPLVEWIGVNHDRI